MKYQLVSKIGAAIGASTVLLAAGTYILVTMNANKAASMIREPQFSSDAISAVLRKELVLRKNVRWTREEWTGSDAPYAKWRSYLMSLKASHAKVRQLAVTLGQNARANPSDPLAAYRWASTSFLAFENGEIDDTSDMYLFAFLETALASPASPRSYNYDRLRFLVNCHSNLMEWRLNGMAARLLKRDPGDIDVKHGLISLFIEGHPPGEMLTAKKMILGEMAQHPNDADLTHMLAKWYYFSYFNNHKETDFEQAEKLYAEAIRLYPITNLNKDDLVKTADYLKFYRHRWLTGTAPR